MSVLRNSLYTEMLLPSVRAAIATGTHVTNHGDGRTSYVAREDCTAAAAAVLASDRHDGKTYDITGPAANADEAVALFSELSRKEIQVVQVDDASYLGRLVEHAGMAQSAAETYASPRQVRPELCPYIHKTADYQEQTSHSGRIGRPAPRKQWRCRASSTTVPPSPNGLLSCPRRGVC